MKITVRYYERETFADPYRRWAGTIRTTTVTVYHDGELFASEEFIGGRQCNAVKEYVKRMKED